MTLLANTDMEATHLEVQTPHVTGGFSAQKRLSRLEPTRRAAVKDRLSQMPKTGRSTYLRAVGGRSPKSAIKAFCLECVGWQRAEVARCTDLACPLWAYRPFRRV
jgi:hypothetical protein